MESTARSRPLGALTRVVFSALFVATAPPLGAWSQGEDPELVQLLREERREADLLRRRGEPAAARAILTEHLAEDAGDGQARLLFALCLFTEDRVQDAIDHAQRVFDEAERAGDRELFAASSRALLEFHLEVGEVSACLAVLDRAGAALDPAADPRSAWLVARVHLECGKRDDARRALLDGSGGESDEWEGLLAVARCEMELGFDQSASESLVAAHEAALASTGQGEPDVLAALGKLYFDVYREVESEVGNSRSAGDQFKAALELDPRHLAAQLGELALYRYNWRRQSRSAADLLEKLLATHPDAVSANLAAASAALDDGQLVAARAHLDRLLELAPLRRDVRTEVAALSWVEHRRDAAREVLAELARVDPKDGRPERELGRHLCELYRFAEAVPFLEQSVARDASDAQAWTELGRALANTGDEERALESLARAEEAARGRKDAWRTNMRLALERIRRDCVVETHGDLTFVWRPDAAEVLRAYLPEFYARARSELSRRYGFTPGPVRIEVFREHKDFSARSTGFEGFPATGVCFGPVVTSLSPLSEMRGNFSWARTSFHEFSHVVHLGLSHNRCPRWITEGLATWEEENKSASWTRNMRRDLLDARANDAVIPVRELNRAFRGPRILFGYYQGGLLCEMLVLQHGFAPMVRLLEAFDSGLDLDGAFAQVFQTTPEDVDRRFLEFVDAKLAGLGLEPRWDPRRAAALRFSLSTRPPEGEAERSRWREDWTTVAWSAWQTGNRLDAEQALRTLSAVELGPRAFFLRGELAMDRGDVERAGELWRAGLAAGGDDFRVRIVLGATAAASGDGEEALEHFLAAEAQFPGFPDGGLAAERKLWTLYDDLGREEEAMAARARWLAWDSDDLETRLVLAEWLAGRGRMEESARLYREANEIDPFRRGLHLRWGRTLAELGRHAEAVREFAVARAVPPHLDADVYRLREKAVSPKEHEAALAGLAGRDLSPEERARELEAALGLSPEALETRSKERALLLGLEALSVLELAQAEHARELARLALEIDPDCEPASKVLERLQ